MSLVQEVPHLTEPDSPSARVDERTESAGRSHAQAAEVLAQFKGRLVATENRLQVAVVPREAGSLQRPVEDRLRQRMRLNSDWEEAPQNASECNTLLLLSF